MQIQLAYQSAYEYSAEVSLSTHLFRLLPRGDHAVVTSALQFQSNAGAAPRYRRDAFDNEVLSVFYPGRADHMHCSLTMQLTLEPKNPYDFLLDTHAIHFPFAYRDEERAALATYLQPVGDTAPTLPFWSPPAAAAEAGTAATLAALTAALHKHLTYERREEGAAQSPAETLTRQAGACRDFAVLQAAVLRGHGLAARLASGYLVELGDEERKAENAMHAWVETYLPGAGWVGLDPTNGTLCDHHHITTAVGLSPQDITPILGRFFHPEASKVTVEMTASLQILA